MTKQLMPLLIAIQLVLMGCAATPEANLNEIALVTDQQKASYSNGVDYMKHLRHDDLGVDQEAFLLGVNDVLANHELRLSPQEITKADAWQMVQQVTHQNAKAAATAAAGQAFLENNLKQAGVKPLPSGLQYKVLAEGNGPNKPKETDSIAFNYRLSNTDGVELGSNIKQGKPLIAPLNKLIPGTKEAILLMHKGAKWQLFLPPNLAYGENGTPDGKIAANETLVFDMELVDINPPEALDGAKTSQDAAAIKPKPSSTR